MAIIGQEIEDYVANQITIRQALHGEGARDTGVRSDNVINVLNSNTSWVKLASGVKIEGFKLTEVGQPTSLSGLELAKKYVLYAGFSKYETVTVDDETVNRLTQREGFLPQNENSSYTYGTYGYSPMPGIISADIKTLTRGSIKKATVKIKINNKEQFDIIDLLYFRLGYTVLLEWGNSMFSSSKINNREIVRNTIIDNPDYFFNSSFGNKQSYRDILPVIESYREKYEGNYDALLGKVSNFQWSFNPDGSYDAEITIISLGDVVESLKTNISTDKQLAQFILTATTLDGVTTPSPSTTTSSDIIEENKDANTISSMLWVWKWINRENIKYDSSLTNIYNFLPFTYVTKTTPWVGEFLQPSTTISGTFYTVRFYYVAYNSKHEAGKQFASPIKDIKPDIAASYPDKFELVEYNEVLNNGVSARVEVLQQELETNGLSTFEKDGYYETRERYGGKTTRVANTSTYKVLVRWEITQTKKVSADSPTKDFDVKDAFWLNSVPKQFYLRLGALLNYVNSNVIPKIDTSSTSSLSYESKPPMFKIDTNTYNNIMYSLPNQISLDPRVCLVGNLNFTTADANGAVEGEQHFSNLYAFRTEDAATSNDPQAAALSHPNKAYTMNIYLNFSFIIESLNSAADERGDTNMFGFLKNICDGLNKALGGINNLEPIINETTNVLQLIDTTPIPETAITPSYILQLYGYNKIGDNYTSNFIRKVDLKTAITPEYATMITVGATAGGYVKGTEATAFSRWNNGLIDRFKEKFVPGNENSFAEPGSVDEAVTNYVEKMLAPGKYPARLGFLPPTNKTGDGFGDLSTDAIENNLSVGTEYFKYIVASQGNQQGGTVGFIPFKIGFSMDGLSGIKIYNKLHIDTTFLPKAYNNTLDLIVTGVSHKLSNNDWETDIEATVIPKTNKLETLVITPATIALSVASGVVGGDAVANLGGYEPLKQLIFSGESSIDGYDSLNHKSKQSTSYKKIFGVTSMSQTIAKVASTATGAVGGYQQLPTYIVKRAQKIGLDPTTALFNETNQDAMGIDIINEKIGPYIKGSQTGTQAQLINAINFLGAAWSSLPVVTNQNGVTVGNTDTGVGSTGYYNDTVKKSVSAVVKAIITVRKNLGGGRPPYIPTYIDWDSL